MIMWRNPVSVFNILQYVLLLLVMVLSLTSPLEPGRWQWWATAGLLLGLGILYGRWPKQRIHLFLGAELLLLILLAVLSPNSVLLGFTFGAHAMILLPNRMGALWIACWAAAVGASLVYHEGLLEGLLDAVLILAGASAFGYAQYALGQARAAHRQSQRLLEELQEANDRLQEYAEQVEEFTLVQERQRLAREIHDTLAQGFTSIVMQLEAMEAALPEEVRQQGSPVERHLHQARSTARASLEQARRLVWALRPEVLEGATLSSAVQRTVARWEEESGIEASTEITGRVYQIQPEAEIILLRAVQEALVNVRKHANATRVTVTLSYMEDLVVLDVKDNGCGFDPSTPQPGGMGGGLEVNSEILLR